MLPSVYPTGHTPEEEHRQTFTECEAWKAECRQPQSCPPGHSVGQDVSSMFTELGRFLKLQLFLNAPLKLVLMAIFTLMKRLWKESPNGT